ncbi:MAG: hypothetical protein SGBAC_003711 [Bacillariaceae sp.]
MWADNDTLKLLESLRAQQSIRNFLCVIIAREDIESRLSESGIEDKEHAASDEPISQSSQIHLGHLGRNGIAEIVCSALETDTRNRCADVFYFVYRESGGNPFHATEMIKSLVSEGYAIRDNNGYWKMQTSGSMNLPSLHDLILAPFHHLPEHLREVAQFAASFEGRTIHHSILSNLVTTLPADAVMKAITQLKVAMGVANDGIASGDFFYFPYGMQKLIYEQLCLAERKTMHQHVLRSLYGHLPAEILDANVFLVLHQSIRSQWFRSTVKQKMELARLCLLAAKRSMSCLAPSSAESYIQKGVACLMDVDDRWRINYALTMELWTRCIEIEFANSNREDVHRLYLEIAQHSRDPLDVVPACRSHILALGEAGEVDRAIEVALKWICQVGESSEQSIDLRKTLTDLIKTRKLIVSSPRVKDPLVDDEDDPLKVLRNSASSLRRPGSWGKNYDRCLRLFNCLIETEYVLGNYNEAKDAINVVLQNARQPYDKCSALHTKLQLVVQTSNRNHALGAEESIKLLSSFGIHIPLKPSRKDVIVEKVKLRAALGMRDISVLASMHTMERDCLMKIIDQLCHFATSSHNDNLVAIVALRAMRISLKTGISKYLPQILVTYAVPLRGSGKLKDAYKLASFVEKLWERFPQENPKFQLLLQSGAMHLKKSFHSSVDEFVYLYGLALANANIEYALTIAMHVPLLHFASGLPLSKSFESQLCIFEEKATQLAQPTFVALFKGFRQFLHNLKGNCSNPLELNGGVMKEDEVLCHFEGNSRLMTLRDFSVLRLTLACIFDDTRTMIAMLDRLKSYPLFDCPVVREHTRMAYIGIAALILGRSSGDREFKKLGQKTLKAFKKLNDIGSKNAPPVYLCLRAIKKHTIEAYERAIRACLAANMLHFAAMMNEQCGKMLLSEGSYDLGTEYLGAALWLYDDWGADGKVQQMKVAFDISKRKQLQTASDTSSSELLSQNKSTLSSSSFQ